jgi:O-antigen/teichoic acid export membrane protein
VSIKKLAGQTIWYGLSNIAAKFLNQLLTPIITYVLNNPSGMVDYGNFSIIYSSIAFINVIYTYGMETAYFRFSANKENNQQTLFQTAFSSLLISSVIFSAILIFYRQELSGLIGLGGHSEYITWAVLVIAVDTMAAIPFARLRQEGRPRKYAFVRLAGIVANIVLTVYFLAYYPSHRGGPDSAFERWYAANTNVGFLILANLAQAIVTFLLLASEWKEFRFKFDAVLWRKVAVYSAPMVIVGLGGMVNETFDRIMLGELLPGTDAVKKIAVAIYAANYKLAIFITLFIQAFRMSAEPFFFSQAADKNAPRTYARVMKWFVIVLCIAFLFTGLYIDVWRYFIHKSYWAGLGVVPILLGANVCLGIYYNLSVWYKITDKMYWGMIITLIGAAVTLYLNFTFIPAYGMYACAWATFAAYASMMVVSYCVGQKYFPVPYNVRKLIAYLGVMMFLYCMQQGVIYMTDILVIRLITASILMFLFFLLVGKAEKKELAGMPVIGKWVR